MGRTDPIPDGLPATKRVAGHRRCRTATLGGHLASCSRCGLHAISHNSCPNRHCPKCQAQPRHVLSRSFVRIRHFRYVAALMGKARNLVFAHERAGKMGLNADDEFFEYVLRGTGDRRCKDEHSPTSYDAAFRAPVGSLKSRGWSISKCIRPAFEMSWSVHAFIAYH